MEEKESDISKEVKYRLLMLKYSRDDPILEANMLEKLIDVYKKRDMKIPNNIQKIITEESRKIRKKIEEELFKKKGEMKKLVEKVKDEKKEGKALSVTEEIFEEIYEKYEEALKYLYDLQRRGIKLGLESMKKILEMLGNPEKGLKVIHVAGTNGKGSVCAMIDSILEDAGYKVGRYTSPHLCRFTERFAVNNKEISKEEVVRLVNYLKPYFERVKLTFFEAVTVMAILYFKQKKVDFVVMEVGLGGRLDATNIVNSIISIITNIELEHTEYLGDNIKKIAMEKAGIIKENGVVVTAAEGEALEVIKSVCEDKNAKLIPLLKCVKREGKIEIDGLLDIELNLDGNFQFSNASVAVTASIALRDLQVNVPDSAIRIGLEYVEWPGRFEFYKKNILLDCAHNESGIIALKREVERLNYKNLILIIGILDDKKFEGMIEKVASIATKIIVTKATTDRAIPIETLAKEVKKHTNNYVTKEKVSEAIAYAKSILGKEDLLLITGSCYVVGEAMVVL